MQASSCAFGRREASRSSSGSMSGLVVIQSVFVGVAEHEFTGGHPVGKAVACVRIRALPLGPVYLRLTDAIGESKRLDAPDILGRQDLQQLKGLGKPLVGHGFFPGFDTVFSGIKQQQHMRHPARFSAPLPVLRGIAAHVAQTAGAAFIAGHAGDELIGKTLDNGFLEPQCPQPFH